MRTLSIAVLIVVSGHAFYLRGQTCVLQPSPATLNGQRPTEINPNVPSAPPNSCGFLQFAWQDFLSLNWPALPVQQSNTSARTRGLPDVSRKIGQGGAQVMGVWEQFQPNWYLFWPNNPPPPASGGDSFAAWNQDAWLPAACGPLRPKAPAGAEPPRIELPRILSSLSKLDAMPGVKQALSFPLIDQDGLYARYEIVTDYQAFNYINAHQLYLLPQLQAFVQHQALQFPVQTANDTGATFIKAAWKPLFNEADQKSGRYHTANAFLFTPGSATVSSTCVGPVPMGLVGLHIVHKTQGFPMWLWATFEQVDNTPADPANPALEPGSAGWSFFRPGLDKPQNQPPKCPDGVTSMPKCDFQPTSSHMGTAPNDKTGGPVQVVRLNPIPKSQNQPALDQINKSAHDLLQQMDPKNVWQFYRLVEAQWQKNANPLPPCKANTGFFPACNVANTTMETFLQNNSCMGCHKIATAPSTPAAASDLTFEFTLAWQPNAAPALHLPIAEPKNAPKKEAK